MVLETRNRPYRSSKVEKRILKRRINIVGEGVGSPETYIPFIVSIPSGTRRRRRHLLAAISVWPGLSRRDRDDKCAENQRESFHTSRFAIFDPRRKEIHPRLGSARVSRAGDGVLSSRT